MAITTMELMELVRNAEGGDVDFLREGVRVLAQHEERPVVLEQGNLVVASFHPELVGETGLHGYVLGKV